ncbi:MAG: molybdate ABC transporter permease subunit [Verrucomicrobiota bacterium]|nr:molybdate ABC transporter permease subunit [Verrucomicrobiota bacterium]
MADEWRIALFTLGVCALSTAIITPFGLALAYLLARKRWRGKTIVEAIVTIPLVIPPVATGLILLRLLGRRSGLGALLHNYLGVDIVFTWRAVVIASAVMSFPLLVRAARVGIEGVDTDLEDVARVFGASSLRVFFAVTLPLAARGIWAGIVLAFARAIGEFGATILVAGNIPGKTTTLSLKIYEAIQLGNDQTAWRLVAVCVLISFLAVWTSQRLARRVSV